jgi:hypothetical protein
MFGFRKEEPDDAERAEIKKLLESTPGPSPWYLQGRGPNFTTKFGETAWVSAGKDPHTTGKTVLQAEQQNLAIFDFQYWISSQNGKLLSWNQSYQSEKQQTTHPVIIRLFDPSLFQPVDFLDEVCLKMSAEKQTIHFNGGQLVKFEIPTGVAGEIRRLTFPEAISKIDELLIPCQSSGISYEDVIRPNFGLMIARPSKGNFEIIPQDWFNTAPLDFGYQWVTQFARHPKTGKIVGGGIRIANFVLSKNYRQVDKQIN